MSSANIAVPAHSDMARIDLNIPELGNKFIDLRDSIPGDSYNFSWVRPLSQVNYLAIHHSATSPAQTPEDIANFHINSNGWGGIGYHFVISKDGIVYYVGDIGTARANVANLNEQVIGICLTGNFTDVEPTEEQLDSAKKLCNFLINYPDLVNVKSRDVVKAHKELPNQSTTCPGDTWTLWKSKIIPGDGNTSSGGGLTKEADNLRLQVDSLQSSLGLVNDQIINLQQTVADKDQEIINLRAQLKVSVEPDDTTLTIPQALFSLYQFLFPPGKVN